MPVVTLPDGTTIDLPDQRAIAGGLVRRVAPARPLGLADRLQQLGPALRMPLNRPLDAPVPDLADMDYEKNFEGVTDAEIDTLNSQLETLENNQKDANFKFQPGDQEAELKVATEELDEINTKKKEIDEVVADFINCRNGR